MKTLGIPQVKGCILTGLFVGCVWEFEGLRV